MRLKEEFEEFQELWNKGFRFNPEQEHQVFYTTNKKKFKAPEGYEAWNVEVFEKDAYLNERLSELGIEPEHNKVELTDHDNVKAVYDVFSANKYGDIDILQYSLKGETYRYNPKGNGNVNHEVLRCQTRLHPQNEFIADGKYDFSAAMNTPFWHPTLLEMYREKVECHTLVITEGQFKAWKATAEGIMTVGLTSISHFRSKDTQELHSEILEFIRACNVKRVIILWDADCRNISSKSLKDGEDLSKRPGDFFGFADSIRESLQKYFQGKESLEIFFATIAQMDKPNSPKGIDDLLIDQPVKRIVADFEQIGSMPGTFIRAQRMNKTHEVKAVKKWFKLDSVYAFYDFHKEQIQKKAFKYYRHGYIIGEDGRPVIDLPSELSEYMYIGTSIYRLLDSPYPVGDKGETNTEKTLVPWTKERLIMSFGKSAPSRIAVLDGFTNIPSHTNYQQIINGHWNLYYDVQHDLVEGEFPTINKLLKHLFEEQFENQLIYDYLTVLWRYPMQKLPIPALYSREQGTGKSTFVYLVKLIFRQNMMIVSPSELTGEFNSLWLTKLIVACEELFLDKRDGYEKLKALTTQKTGSRNEKGKAQTEMWIFLHFILLSNYDNFIKIDDTDSRLWIRQVKPLKEQINDFDLMLEKEVPAFVNFLNSREITHEKNGRFYFHPSVYSTDARKHVIQQGQPGMIKDIKHYLEEMFLLTGIDQIKMSAGDLKSYVKLNQSPHYIAEAVKFHLKCEKNLNGKGNDEPCTYSFPVRMEAHEHGYDYVKTRSRALIFKREDFVKNEETKKEIEQMAEATE